MGIFKDGLNWRRSVMTPKQTKANDDEMLDLQKADRKRELQNRKRWLDNHNIVFRSHDKIYGYPRGSKDDNFEVQEGLRILHWPLDAKIDIIFIHGVTGGPVSTWTKNGVLWPKDLLPKDIPNARIACWGYKTSTRDESVLAGDETAYLLADSMCADLYEPGGFQCRPLIFVAHDLGGLQVQRGLWVAQTGWRPWARGIMLNTHAVLFLGLPGRTGRQAKVLERLSGCHPILQEPEDISQASQEDLTQDEIEQIELETRLGELERNFRDMATESSVKLGYCNPLVSLPGNEIFDSSFDDEEDEARLKRCKLPMLKAEIITVPLNHLDMTMFSSRLDVGYLAIVGLLKRWSQEPFDHFPFCGGTGSLYSGFGKKEGYF